MRPIRAALLALALCTACAAAAARPAHAWDGRVYAYDNSHFSGSYCWWTLDNYDWRYAEWAVPHAGTCSGLSGLNGMNDEASSLMNTGYPGNRADVQFYRDAEKRGPWLCLRHGERWADLSLGYERFSDGTNANDRISGHRWTTC